MCARKRRLERKKMRKLFPGDKTNLLIYDATTLTRDEAMNLISTVHRSCCGTSDYYRKANSLLRTAERVRRQPEWKEYEAELEERKIAQDEGFQRTPKLWLER